MAARTRPRQPPPPTSPAVYPEHLGFILAEEDMLKTYLENTVTLPTNTGQEIPVRVWYRYPAAEHATTYPFITIDFIGIEPAYDLWQSEYRLYINSDEEENSDTGDISGHRLHDPSTSPNITNSNLANFFWRRNYLAYRLFYQLGLWSNNAIIDRILSARMIRDIVMPRPSWLFCEADGVWKRMETLGWTAADLVSQEGGNKRVFRKLFTMSIQTEIPQDRLNSLINQNPIIKKFLYRIYETESGGYVSGEDPSPPDVTTIDPTNNWVIGAEQP